MGAPQVVELTAEQFDAIIAALASLQSSVENYVMVCAVVGVVLGAFLAFEIAAFVFWGRVFRE